MPKLKTTTSDEDRFYEFMDKASELEDAWLTVPGNWRHRDGYRIWSPHGIATIPLEHAENPFKPDREDNTRCNAVMFAFRFRDGVWPPRTAIMAPFGIDVHGNEMNALFTYAAWRRDRSARHPRRSGRSVAQLHVEDIPALGAGPCDWRGVLIGNPQNAISVGLPLPCRCAVGRQELRFCLRCGVPVDEVVLSIRHRGGRCAEAHCDCGDG
jgi:hypothetical protein